MKHAFGALISIILLVIYTYLIRYGVDIIACETTSECMSPTIEDFNANMTSALALISGLVSALVITEFAVTKPGNFPAMRLVSDSVSAKVQKVLKWVIGLYICVWIAAGLNAFIVAFLGNPDVLEPITNLGQAWLGIAVGAGYAYLGVNPK